MEKFDTHYNDPRLTGLYDLDSGWSVDRDFYLSLADTPNQKVLDLGCGTGLLCNAYAEKGHKVTGVDPSAEMLKIASQKPRGQDIEWIQSSAQDYQSNNFFDLIIMTGHAFQALIEDDDIKAALKTMRRHLNSGGKIVFESRNPMIDWQNRWDYDMEIETPEGNVHESRRFIEMNDGRMVFDLLYRLPEETLISKSKLRFLSCHEIKRGLQRADLRVETILGDWDGQLFDPKVSPEMIFIVRAA